MLCSSCGTEYADDLDTCPCCGASLKKSPVTDDTIPLAPISEAVLAHARKKPVKLDIAAILAAGPDFAPAPEPDGSEPAQSTPDSDETSDSPEAADDAAEQAVQPSSDGEPAADEAPDEPINPVEVLLLSLCILLGMAIAVMIILIIWPNLINMLFYRA